MALPHRSQSQRSLPRRFSETTLRAVVACAAAAVVFACGEPAAPAASVVTQDDPQGGAWMAVSAGREHTCALTADSAAWCWGSNEHLQLGVPRGSTTCTRPHDDRAVVCELTPVRVSGTLRFARIRAGGSLTCGLADDARVYCWGDNVHGQLGSPGPRETFLPTPVADSARYVDLAVGGDHACGLRTDLTVACWGDNDFGQVGLSSIGIGSASPSPVQTVVALVALAAGEKRNCGLSGSGLAYCWGAQWSGVSAGRDVLRPQSRPAPVPGSPAFIGVSAGGQAACGVGVDAHVYCWQANHAAGFGTDSVVGSVSPVPARTNLQFVRVSTGAAHTCAVAVDGRAYCWGADDHGQLGGYTAGLLSRCDSITCSIAPVPLPGWRAFSSVSAGLGDHTCGVTVAGNLYCWGAGAMGQRGGGTRFDSAFPSMVVLRAM